MFQGKFELNQIQARGDMNEGGIVSFLLLSQILEEDRPLPTRAGIGALPYVLLPPSLAESKQKQRRQLRLVFLQFHVGENVASPV